MEKIVTKLQEFIKLREKISRELEAVKNIIPDTQFETTFVKGRQYELNRWLTYIDNLINADFDRS